MTDRITIPVTRADLSAAFPNNPKLVRAFEQLFNAAAVNTQAVTTGTAATAALQDATVVTLSPNDTFTNERVLAVDPDVFALTDSGTNIILSLIAAVVIGAGGKCSLVLEGDTLVSLPSTGRVFTSAIGPYADDAAAATAGVLVGEAYKKPAGVMAWRQT